LVNLWVEREDLVVSRDGHRGLQETGVGADKDVGGFALPEAGIWDGCPILIQCEAIHNVNRAQDTTGGVDLGCQQARG